MLSQGRESKAVAVCSSCLVFCVSVCLCYSEQTAGICTLQVWSRVQLLRNVRAA
jgi:hypothetical protein